MKLEFSSEHPCRIFQISHEIMDIETIEQPESLQNLHNLKIEKYTHYIQTFFFFEVVGS